MVYKMREESRKGKGREVVGGKDDPFLSLLAPYLQGAHSAAHLPVKMLILSRR